MRKKNTQESEDEWWARLDKRIAARLFSICTIVTDSFKINLVPDLKFILLCRYSQNCKNVHCL